MVIRTSVPGEAVLLSEFAYRSKASWGYSSRFMAACREELTYTAEDYRHLHIEVLETTGIAGFYALRHESASVAELEALFVDHRHLGCGFGTALMQHAKCYARNAGYRRIVIQSDPNAESFYRASGAYRHGFRESHSIPGRALPALHIELT